MIDMPRMIDDGTTSALSVRRNNSSWSSIVLAAIVLPMLYVLSSGPMLILAFRHNITTTPDGHGRLIEIDYVAVHVWWPTVYAPLVWASEQSWGEPLHWYWERIAT
jgi:hypothetical protein